MSAPAIYSVALYEAEKVGHVRPVTVAICHNGSGLWWCQVDEPHSELSGRVTEDMVTAEQDCSNQADRLTRLGWYVTRTQTPYPSTCG